MAALLKHGWTKPSTILYASEYPPNQGAFSYALGQALDVGAHLIIFHVFAGRETPLEDPARRSIYARARIERNRFEPLAQRARALGLQCRIVVRPGDPAEQILACLREKKVDRLFLGARTPGPVGRLLVGSVAERVLRSADVPVSIVGPYIIGGNCQNCATRTILCSVAAHRTSRIVVAFAAEIAAGTGALLILQQVIPHQDSSQILAGRSLQQAEADLAALIPQDLKDAIAFETHVLLGDPSEEVLYQGRVRNANLIVLGAHEASHFAAITPACFVYKVLAYARCPVLTLSPVLMRGCGALNEVAPVDLEDRFLAGVI